MGIIARGSSYLDDKLLSIVGTQAHPHGCPRMRSCSTRSTAHIGSRHRTCVQLYCLYTLDRDMRYADHEDYGGTDFKSVLHVCIYESNMYCTVLA